MVTGPLCGRTGRHASNFGAKAGCAGARGLDS